MFGLIGPHVFPDTAPDRPSVSFFDPFNMKKILKQTIALTLLSLLALSMSGCLNKAPDESAMPWSRPANWENQVPGFR